VRLVKLENLALLVRHTNEIKRAEGGKCL